MDAFLLILFFSSCIWLFCFIPILGLVPHSIEKQQIHPDAMQLLKITSILIPARNEAGNIGFLLRSLKNQVPVFEILVIDDHSDDQTEKIAKQFGMTVISLEKESLVLPPGWKGKNWALHNGVARAKGEYYLFLDADTVLNENGLLKIASSFLENTKKPVSLLPEHRPVKFWELFCGIPLFLSLLGVSAGKAKGFFGPCIFTSANDYKKAGGHQRIKNSILDDVDLGKKYIEQGAVPVLARGKDVISFRMYQDNFSQMRQGWVKNLSLGIGELPAPIRLAFMGIATGTITAILGLIMVLGHVLDVFPLTLPVSDRIIVASGFVLYIFYAIGYFLTVRSVQKKSVLFALTFPAAGLAFLIFWIESQVRKRTRADVLWKGRSMKMERVDNEHQK